MNLTFIHFIYLFYNLKYFGILIIRQEENLLVTNIFKS